MCFKSTIQSKTKVIPVISGAPAIKLQHNQQIDLI